MRIFMQNIYDNQNWLKIKIFHGCFFFFYKNPFDMQKQSAAYTSTLRPVKNVIYIIYVFNNFT